jgi:SAM-dependent methyltransferase
VWNLISGRTTQFLYFDGILDRRAWKGSKILDFGGNIGGFLVGAGDAIDHADYWCVDINKTVVEQGRRNYPKAHFVHFDRYNPQYNPDGIRHLPIPACGVQFDFIIAFSVFTHAHPREMMELVAQLRSMLTPQGVLAFTFTDPSYDRSWSDPRLPSGTGVREMLERDKDKIPALEIEELVKRAEQSQWCLLIDDRLFVEPGDEFSHQEHEGRPGESYCSYFKPEWIQSLFPDGRVHAPVSPEWQHCCVLRRL